MRIASASALAPDVVRRRLLIGLAAAAPALALGTVTIRQRGAAPHLAAGGIPQRRNIGVLDENDPYVEVYRDAVRILRERSARDPMAPTGWDAIAVQHALYCSSATPRLQVHWGWDFLTWHRGFLWMLERIMREAVREPQFALPYWDASRQRAIPALYWGADNPLNDVTRTQGPGDALPDDLLDVNGAIGLQSFYAFGGYPYDNAGGDLIEGNLEQGFHNNVHNWVGGNMGAFPTAGFDPLFSAHHNNVDRAWEAWRARGGSEGNPHEARWLERTYQFVNERGQLERVAVRDLLDPAKLGYGFDDLAFGERQQPDPVLEDSGDVRLLVDGAFAATERVPRVLRLERSSIPIHPYCCRTFLRRGTGRAVYVGTFTVLPVIRAGAQSLDRSVTMQLALSPSARAALAGEGPIELILSGVPLKGRQIPKTPVRELRARLTDGLA